MEGQIIAIGGSGFSDGQSDVAINRYILSQSVSPRPKICYLPQAGGESDEYIWRFYRAFSELGAQPNHLSLFAPHTADIEGFLEEQDILYVGGGNTRSLLALWRGWEVDSVLRRLWQNGMILAGPSAGAICWFEEGSTDSIPGRLSVLNCLGFLEGSCCPHYNSEPDRRPSYRAMVGEGRCRPGFALDDHAALRFVGDKLAESVSAAEGAAVYRVERNGDKVEETKLDCRSILEIDAIPGSQ